MNYLVRKMLCCLAESTHVYRKTVEDCYDYCIFRYNVGEPKEPKEGKDACVDRVLECLKEMKK